MNKSETSRVEIAFNLHLILGTIKVIFTCFLKLTPGSVNFPEKYIFLLVQVKVFSVTTESGRLTRSLPFCQHLLGLMKNYSATEAKDRA